MVIRQITENKKQLIDLLLLGDEQESMIDRYLDRGSLFALYDEDLKTACVVTEVDKLTVELKNIATYERYQGKGYGSALISYLFGYFGGRYKTMLVGTGDVPSALSFYRQCGFAPSHRVRNFFTENYDHPMFENGIQLVDMVYLRKEMSDTGNYYVRKATGSDYSTLKELFQNTVLTVNRKDYPAEEVEDWASCGNSLPHWTKLLAEHDYYVAESCSSGTAGFAAINDTGYIHALFVHKDFLRCGVATLLYRTLENYAQDRGIKRLTSEVSITARPFFEKQGFKVDQEQKRRANKLYLTNYKMSKELG